MVVLGSGGQFAIACMERLQTRGMVGRMNRRRFWRVVLGMACCGFVAGCGYHLAGHGSDALPKTIHVIAVPAMENKSSTFKIEQKLTAATIHEFLAKTNYKIVSDPNAGDAVLTGKVLSLEILPLLFQTRPSPTATTRVPPRRLQP